MDQNLCFNIFIFLIILIVIKYISPNPDSVLFVLKKYLNFLLFKINRFLKQIFNCSEDFGIVTFKGLKEFQDKAPSFVSYHQNMFIQKMIEKNNALDVKILKKLYGFMEKMVTTDTDDYFLTVSDSEQKELSENELNKIKTIIFNKLNSGSFKFSNLTIQQPVTYYNNISGKEVNPFSFTVICDNNIGLLKVFISIDIRNDVVRNGSYVVIKKIRLNLNTDTDTDNKKVYYEINDDVTNKVISKSLESCEPQPSYYDNPVNLNLKLNDSDNYNIDVDQLEIPNYDDILNSYTEENELPVHNNNLNMSMPIVDFSKNFKTPINFSSLEASNTEDTMYNMLDDVLSFKIPSEKNHSTEISLNSSSKVPNNIMSMPQPNNLRL